ncbi:hypothetical protein NE634_04650 [Lacrimispora saccharolytica]|nr:hypothetical protein [Lacrimispora saccharolytica]
MGFLQITLGDVIGYVLILSGFALSISIQMRISSHHNKKDTNKVNQSNSKIKGDQVGRDKKC